MQRLTLNLADDGSAFVQEAFAPDGSRIMSYSFTLAELGTWEPEDATRYVGNVTLASLAALWKKLQRYPYCHLLNGDRKRCPTQVRFKPTTTRAAYLATSVATNPDRLLVHRCTPQAIVDTALPLAWLARGGADPSADTLGTVLLRAMANLHPDAFLPFPALLLAGGVPC